MLFLWIAQPAQAAPGDLDSTFGNQGIVRRRMGNGPERLDALAVQPDGKILVANEAAYGGSFFDDGGIFTLARLNPDGSFDTSFADQGILFAPLGGFVPQAIALQSDGKIVAVGFNREVSAFYTVRLLPNGSLDSGFGIGGVVVTPADAANSSAADVAIQPDGKIVVVGTVLPINNNEAIRLLRLLPNGDLDPSFDGDGRLLVTIAGHTTRANDVEVMSNGKIVVMGEAITTDGQLVSLLVRLNANGKFDKSFDNDGYLLVTAPTLSNLIIRDSVVLPDGKIVSAGWGSVGDSPLAILLMRHNANGSLDTTFDGDGIVVDNLGINTDTSFAETLTVQPDGKLVIAGSNEQEAGSFGIIKRYLANGSSDASFGDQGLVRGPAGSNFEQMVRTPIGAILAAGGYGRGEELLLQVTTAGVPDASFGQAGQKIVDLTSGNSFFSALRLTTDGKIVAVGYRAIDPGSDDEEAVRQLVVARFLSNGSFDPSFDGDGLVETNITVQPHSVDLGVNADGSLRIYTTRENPDNSQFELVIIHLLSNGTLDPALGSGTGVQFVPLDPSFNPGEIRIDSSGRVLISGNSLISSETPARYVFAIARFLPTGSPDSSFAGGYIRLTSIPGENVGGQLVVQPDGKIVLAGSHQEVVNDILLSQFAVVRLTDAGTLDPTFGNNGYIRTLELGNYAFFHLLLQPDGKYLLAGSKVVNGDPSVVALMMRLNANGSVDQSFGQAGVVISSPDADQTLLLNDGKILKVGTQRCDNFRGLLLQRYLANGAIDPNFGSGGNQCISLPNFAIYTALAQADGKVLLGGDQRSTLALARLTVAGDAPTTANITIALDTIRDLPAGSDAGDHSFSGGLGAFVLEDPAGLQPNQRSFEVAPGNYSFSVVTPANHRILSITCSPDTNSTEIRDGQGKITGMSLTSARGATIRCLVISLRSENTKIVVKIRNKGQKPSGWTVKIRNLSNGAEFRDAGVTRNGDITFAKLPIGVYEVCESLQAGWYHPYSCALVVLNKVGRAQSVTFNNQVSGAEAQSLAEGVEPVVIADEPEDVEDGELGTPPTESMQQFYLPMIVQE